MAYLNYCVRKNLQDLGAEPKHYGIVKSVGTIKVPELAEYIAPRAGVSVGNVRGILEDLGYIASEALQNGEHVRLGTLGTLQIKFSTKGCVAREQWNTSMIRKIRVHLRLTTKAKADIAYRVPMRKITPQLFYMNPYTPKPKPEEQNEDVSETETV